MRSAAAALIPRLPRATILLLLLLLGGCGPKSAAAVDPTLPEQVMELPDLKPLQILEEGAEHLDPTPRARALEWLIRLDPAPAGGTWGPRALYDPSAWVQRAGVRALADRLTEPATRGLLEEYVALAQGDPYTRALAGVALAPDGSAAAATTLAAAWRAESEPWLIAPLALASAAHGDTEAVAALSQALATGEIGLELDFMRAVGASGHPELAESLREGGRWVEEELRLPFAIAQVQLGDPSGEQALRKALQDPDPEVRFGVIDLLVDLDHPTATALLQRAKGDSTELVRWYARLALAARDGTDPDAFEKAWLDPDREVRALAVRLSARAASDPVAGSNRRVAKAAEALAHQGLLDPEGPVRLQAVRAAGSMEIRGEADNVAALTREGWVELRVEAAGVALALGHAPS